MKQSAKILILLLLPFFTFSQEKEIYTDKVEDLKILVISFCLEKDGRTSNVKMIEEKSTLKNQEMINKVIDVLKTQISEGYAGDRQCLDLRFTFINSKFENAKLNEQECASLMYFRTGEFIYTDPSFSNTIVKRDENFQTEIYNDKLLKAKIEWFSDCNYKLTYLDAEGNIEKSKPSLLVEIVGVLENQSVIYTATDGELRFSGIMKKK